MTAQIRHLRTGPIRVERHGRQVKAAWFVPGGPPSTATLNAHSAETARLLVDALLTEPDALDPSPEAFVIRQIATVRAAVYRGRRRCGRIDMTPPGQVTT